MPRRYANSKYRETWKDKHRKGWRDYGRRGGEEGA